MSSNYSAFIPKLQLQLEQMQSLAEQTSQNSVWLTHVAEMESLQARLTAIANPTSLQLERATQGITAFFDRLQLQNKLNGIEGVANRLRATDEAMAHIAAAIRNTGILANAARFESAITALIPYIEQSKRIAELASPENFPNWRRLEACFEPSLLAFDTWKTHTHNEVANNDSEILLPLRERYISGEILTPPDVAPKGSTEIITEIDIHIDETITDALAKLHPKLYVVWQGAWQALHSDNPDKLRHVFISARELINHLLHILAPDDEVKAWSQKPDHYRDKRPTRAARLLFIYAGVNTPTLRSFIEADVKACVQLIDLLNNGTHGLEAELTYWQLIMCLRKVHSFMCSLIEAKRLGARR